MPKTTRPFGLQSATNICRPSKFCLLTLVSIPIPIVSSATLCCTRLWWWTKFCQRAKSKNWTKFCKYCQNGATFENSTTSGKLQCTSQAKSAGSSSSGKMNVRWSWRKNGLWRITFSQLKATSLSVIWFKSLSNRRNRTWKLQKLKCSIELIWNLLLKVSSPSCFPADRGNRICAGSKHSSTSTIWSQRSRWSSLQIPVWLKSLKIRSLSLHWVRHQRTRFHSRKSCWAPEETNCSKRCAWSRWVATPTRVR